MHWFTPLQETLSRVEIAEPAAFGEATIDHAVPFQRSITVFFFGGRGETSGFGGPVLADRKAVAGG